LELSEIIQKGEKKMDRRIVIAGNDHMATLRNCGGYYVCPKDSSGRRLGPLVGYAGRYDAQDGSRKQFVGDVYANFAKAEIYPEVVRFFAQRLVVPLAKAVLPQRIDAFCGAPYGGYTLADTLGLVNLDQMVIKAEKKVIELATGLSREKSQLIFARHEVVPGLSYVIVEDVCNNFSTTAELIALIEAAGGKVVAIACFLNRSLEVDGLFAPTIGDGLPCWPVISLVRKPIKEYRQDDPAVAEDVANNNVVWKPKNEWARLAQAMTDHEPERGA
jgi:orotate phosphoribosyltransferase